MSVRHIMLTFGRLERGGAEMRFLEVCRAIAVRSLPYRFTIYVVSGQPGQLDDAFRATGAKIVFGKPGAAAVPDLAAACRRERPDVLHANGGLGAAFFMLAGWIARVPLRVANLHSMGYDERGIGRSLRSQIYRPMLHWFAHAVVGVAEGIRQLSRTPAHQWRTIYHGLEKTDFERLRAAPSNFLSVLVLGRLVEAKNPVRMLPVIESLLRSGRKNVELRFVGGGPLADVISREVEARGLTQVVRLVGVTDDPLMAASQASVLALPSKREGLPGVVLEALSVGTPVVASDLPGVREIASHVMGVTSMSADADDVEWASALENAATLDRAAIALSFAGSPFQMQKHLRQLESLWLGD